MDTPAHRYRYGYRDRYVLVMHIQCEFGDLMMGLRYDSAASGLVLFLTTAYSGQT